MNINWFSFFDKGISTFVGYLIPKPLQNSIGTI